VHQIFTLVLITLTIQKIQEFLELVKEDADELVLCGDIFDLWRCPVDRILNRYPMKTTYETLQSTIKEIPTTIIRGNHDYNLWNKIALPVKVTDSFFSNDIYFCDGWQFDIRQKVGHVFYGSIVRSPRFCKTIFKAPFELKIMEIEHRRHGKNTHEKAQEFLKKQRFKYMIMGHTHVPIADDRLFDCGDMIDNFTYVVIKNGKPTLKKLRDDSLGILSEKDYFQTQSEELPFPT
jgi:UDP-2,3-diacylglucosamine pyrophosphatase LpxH